MLHSHEFHRGSPQGVSKKRRDPVSTDVLAFTSSTRNQDLEALRTCAAGVGRSFQQLVRAILQDSRLAIEDMSPYAAGRDRVQHIESLALYAEHLTDQLLAYSGQLPLDSEEVDLSQLVQDTTHLHWLVPKNVSLQYHLHPQLPRIRADVTRIRQVAINLITNSTEAIGDQRGRIDVSTGIDDAQYLGEPWVYLDVKDSGDGMDERTRSQVFVPFFTTKAGSRGLGLAAALGIVRQHDGSIQLDSRPGHGTAVRILLPVGKSTSSRASRIKSPPERSNGAARAWTSK